MRTAYAYGYWREVRSVLREELGDTYASLRLWWLDVLEVLGALRAGFPGVLRRTGRALLGAALAPVYAAGWLAGGIVLLTVGAFVLITAAARLGWSDAQKRGRHGAA